MSREGLHKSRSRNTRIVAEVRAMIFVAVALGQVPAIALGDLCQNARRRRGLKAGWCRG